MTAALPLPPLLPSPPALPVLRSLRCLPALPSLRSLPALPNLPALPSRLTLACPPWLSRWRRPLELRVDVPAEPAGLAADLTRLYERLQSRQGSQRIGTTGPGWVVHHREADGEHYLYVEDAANGRLAGYTVLNRLLEVGRRVDPHVRAPHSKFAPSYRRQGLGTLLYRWGLDRGYCLISGARQSEAAHALWRSLGRHYPLGFVDLHDKSLRYLGPAVSPPVFDDLHTRLVLLGRGWTIERLVDELERRPPPPRPTGGWPTGTPLSDRRRAASAGR